MLSKRNKKSDTMLVKDKKKSKSRRNLAKPQSMRVLSSEFRIPNSLPADSGHSRDSSNFNHGEELETVHEKISKKKKSKSKTKKNTAETGSDHVKTSKKKKKKKSDNAASDDETELVPSSREKV